MTVMMGMMMAADRTREFDKYPEAERGCTLGSKYAWMSVDILAVDICCRLPAKAYGGLMIEKITWIGRIHPGAAPVDSSRPAQVMKAQSSHSDEHEQQLGKEGGELGQGGEGRIL
jgi:hypothetical protein